MESLWQDLRFSLRALRRRPGPTAVLVLTLALGIGLVSGVFSVTDSVLLRALPFKGADRIVQIAGVRRQEAKVEAWPISYLDYADWSRRGGGFAGLAAYGDLNSFTLSAGDSPQHLDGELVSAGYFRVLGVEPFVGRTFLAEEDSAGDPRAVAILGYDLWRDRFAADPGIVRRQILLDGRSFQVVGVMPRGFRGATDGAQIWLPLSIASQTLGRSYLEMRRLRWLTVLARLAPGGATASAQASLDVATASLEREHPDTNRGIGGVVTPLQEAWVGNLRASLLALLAGAGLVLLIACANVASLLLTQAVERRREISLRSALGAGRFRLARQLLTESLVLSLCGCALGLLLTLAVTSLLDVTRAAGLRSFVHLGLNPRAVGVTLAVSLLCGMGFGLAPLYLAWRTDAAALKEGAKGSLRQGLQSALVVAEVALSLALLIAAGLVVRSFEELQSTHLGFRTDLLTVRLDLKDKTYLEDANVLALLRRLPAALGALPGVRSVALEGPGLPTDDGTVASFTAETRRDPADDAAFRIGMHHVTPGYFSTLGISLLDGRDFTAHDDKRQLHFSVLVSDSVARRLWPGTRAIGKRLKIGRRRGDFPWYGVIGVVSDARQQGLSAPEGAPKPETADIYLSALQFLPNTPPTVNVLVRPAESGYAASLVQPVRRAIRAIDPGLAAYDAATLGERLWKQTAQPRLLVELMGLFALLASALAAIGIYGIVTNSVVRRTREIGIRIALGADRRAVIGSIVGWGAMLTTAGIAIGLGAALVLSKLLARFLHRIHAVDPPTFLATALLLLGIAVLSTYVAARRVSRIEPSEALRVE
jgi:putative ABC transport system permease protein